MTAPDELQRAVEGLTVATQKRDAGCQQDARHTWGSQRGDKGKYLEAERSAATVAGVRLNDLRLLLSERAELLATVERMRAALWPFAQVKPTAESGFVNICALNVDVIAARAALTTGEATIPNAGERG